MEAQLLALIAEIKLPQAIVDQLVALGLTNAEDLYWSWQVQEHRESQIKAILGTSGLPAPEGGNVMASIEANCVCCIFDV